MTREDIAKSLKPLEWDIWENGKYHFANINETYEVMILAKEDGRFLFKINKRRDNSSYVLSVFDTVSEAKDRAREWQISHVCSMFEMNN